MVPAVLTHKLGMLRLLDLLTLSTEYFYEQRRQGKHDPLDRQPPPADKAPPQASAMLGNELRRCYQLRGYTIASALRASVYVGVTVWIPRLLHIGLLVRVWLLGDRLSVFRGTLILIILHDTPSFLCVLAGLD